MRRIAILAISILVALFTMSRPTYAFWNNTSTTITNTILIGEWEFSQTLIWQPNFEYNEGDIVYWNGNLWVRNSRGSGSNQEPSFDPPGRNFWIPLED